MLMRFALIMWCCFWWCWVLSLMVIGIPFFGYPLFFFNMIKLDSVCSSLWFSLVLPILLLFCHLALSVHHCSCLWLSLFLPILSLSFHGYECWFKALVFLPHPLIFLPLFITVPVFVHHYGSKYSLVILTRLWMLVYLSSLDSVCSSLWMILLVLVCSVL